VKQVSGKELAAIVKRKGWSLERVKGSHHIFLKPGRRERLVIPFTEIPRSTSACFGPL
jgi:predicted RNA binding protein YcfA (HicA-like mRNA interferase family)